MDSRTKRLIPTVVVLAILGGLGAIWVNLYPDFLWFKVVDYWDVYFKILTTKIGIGAIVGLCYLIILLTNLLIIYRLTPAHLSPAFMGGADFTGGATDNPGATRRLIYGGLTLLAVLFSILMGYTASDRWEIYLRFANADELVFPAATPIVVEEGLNANEIPVAPLELEAKNIKVGDPIQVQIDGASQEARVEAVLERSIRLSTTVQIEAGQKAFFTSPARDPIFNKDVTYYVFEMPFWRYICGTLFGIFLLVTIFAVVIYFFHGLITGDTSQFRFRPPFNVKAHLFTLVGITLLCRAWNYQFAMYDLLYTSNNIVRGGGGYAAIHARLPVLWIMLGITVLCALIFIVSIFLKRNHTLAFGAFAVFLIAGVLGQAYPVAIQRWQVEPRKQVLEADYINYNIKATLQAYGLAEDTVTEQEYPLTEQLNYDDIRSPENAPVFNSIRLWDWRPLRRTFRQLQELRSQYDFNDVDIDRYIVDDEIRQVMLSGRELNINELPVEIRNDWYKQTYTYTHGYGAVVSPVNEIENGKPNMYIQGLPPIDYDEQWQHRFNETPGPRIYYGERTNRYVIVHPDRPQGLEFDYPQEGQQYAEYAYQGTGGVPLNSFWRKLVYMLKFDNEINFVLPGEISATSKILYDRNIRERVQKIAPFLRYDGDPYIVIYKGRLVWIIDAYTITHRYPYAVSMEEFVSERRRQIARTQRDSEPWGNYIRNAVKVVVDAYDGSVDFYVMEREQDPIVECYRKIFPDLFKPFEEMPAELKTHIRYPTSMFLIQARVYQDYHMKDPVTFYAGEDKWEIGRELYDNTDAQTRPAAPPQQRSPFVPQQVPQNSGVNGQLVEPYYVVIRLPGQEKAEFMLMLPYTPLNKPNLTAWLAARCDLPQYGQLLVYRFPKGKQVAGPMQVENFISQEPEISQQISLWNTQGSRVLRGNLLILPMNDSLLYVEPIYIQSEDEKTAIPELRRVVIGYGNEVVWGESLDEALVKMFGQGTRLQATTTTPTVETATDTGTNQTSLRSLIQQANRYFTQAQDAQRAGDWAEYGRALQLLEDTLQQLGRNTQ